jgi:hypothetical protein
VVEKEEALLLLLRDGRVKETRGASAQTDAARGADGATAAARRRRRASEREPGGQRRESINTLATFSVGYRPVRKGHSLFALFQGRAVGKQAKEEKKRMEGFGAAPRAAAGRPSKRKNEARGAKPFPALPTASTREAAAA